MNKEKAHQNRDLLVVIKEFLANDALDSIVFKSDENINQNRFVSRLTYVVFPSFKNDLKYEVEVLSNSEDDPKFLCFVNDFYDDVEFVDEKGKELVGQNEEQRLTSAKKDGYPLAVMFVGHERLSDKTGLIFACLRDVNAMEVFTAIHHVSTHLIRDVASALN